MKRYCVSCGYYPHWGKHCPNKKSGHKNDATFKNRMGDSNDNCIPNRTLLEGKLDLPINLLKWLTNLKICYTNSLDKMYPVAPLHKIKNCSINSVAVNTPHSSIFKLKADSGATCHYLKNEHNSFLQNLTKLSDGPYATLPNNSTIQVTHSGFLPLSDILSPQAKISFIFPGLSNESLLLVGKFCNDNCISFFTKHKSIF